MLLRNTSAKYYNETLVFELVDKRSEESKSVNEFFSIISSKILTYFSPIDAYLCKYFVNSVPIISLLSCLSFAL